MRDVDICSPAQEHREAMRLSWKSRHFPLGTILVGILVLGSLLPTVLTRLALSPMNPMP
jgi:hypothetical protein